MVRENRKLVQNWSCASFGIHGTDDSWRGFAHFKRKVMKDK